MLDRHVTGSGGDSVKRDITSLLDCVTPAPIDRHGTDPAHDSQAQPRWPAGLIAGGPVPVPERQAGDSRPRSHRSGPLRGRQTLRINCESSESALLRTAWSRRRRLDLVDRSGRAKDHDGCGHQ